MSEPGGSVPNVNLLVAKVTQESIESDVDIDFTTFVSRITAYASAINLTKGVDISHGKIKRIYNLSGANIVINSDINLDGAATDTLTLADNGWIELNKYDSKIPPYFNLDRYYP